MDCGSIVCILPRDLLREIAIRCSDLGQLSTCCVEWKRATDDVIDVPDAFQKWTMMLPPPGTRNRMRIDDYLRLRAFRRFIDGAERRASTDPGSARRVVDWLVNELFQEEEPTFVMRDVLAARGKVHLVRALMALNHDFHEDHFDVIQATNDAATAAATNGHVDVVKELQRHAYVVNASSLQAAAAAGHCELLETMLDQSRKAARPIEPKCMQKALSISVAEGHLGATVILLRNMTPDDVLESDAVISACCAGHVRCVDLLLGTLSENIPAWWTSFEWRKMWRACVVRAACADRLRVLKRLMCMGRTVFNDDTCCSLPRRRHGKCMRQRVACSTATTTTDEDQEPGIGDVRSALQVLCADMGKCGPSTLAWLLDTPPGTYVIPIRHAACHRMFRTALLNAATTDDTVTVARLLRELPTQRTRRMTMMLDEVLYACIVKMSVGVAALLLDVGAPFHPHTLSVVIYFTAAMGTGETFERVISSDAFNRLESRKAQDDILNRALLIAVSNGREDVVDALIEIRPDTVGSDSECVIAAFSGGHLTLASKFLTRLRSTGRDMTTMELFRVMASGYRSAFYTAIEMRSPHEFQCIERIKSALTAAIYRNDPVLVCEMLRVFERCIGSECVDSLEIAATRGYVEIIDILLKNIVRMNEHVMLRMGDSMRNAAAFGQTDAVVRLYEWCVEKQMEPDTISNYIQSAVIAAASMNQTHTLRVLLHGNGVRTGPTQLGMQHALSMAVSRGHIDVVRMLVADQRTPLSFETFASANAHGHTLILHRLLMTLRKRQNKE